MDRTDAINIAEKYASVIKRHIMAASRSFFSAHMQRVPITKKVILPLSSRNSKIQWRYNWS